MPGTSPRDSEEIPLPTLNSPKTFDYANQSPRSAKRPHRARKEPVHDHSADHESDSDSTATNSSDEFDWDAEDDALSVKQNLNKAKATRGRRVWRAFMKLARPVRTLVIACIGAGILITPLLVFRLRFNSSPARIQAHTWSLWLTIIWAAACATFLLVDLIPRLILRLLWLIGHRIERLQSTIELTTAILPWLKFTLDAAWAWISLSIITATYKPPGSYWNIVNRIVQALFAASCLLLAEKVFLHYVAINFHRKALAERIAENNLGLEALDRLSNAQFTHSNRRTPDNHGKRGHRIKGSSFELLHGHRGHIDDNDKNGSSDGSPVEKGEKGYVMFDDERTASPAATTRQLSNADRRRHRRSAVTAVIVDGLGGAIGQVALKNSKFNRAGDFGSLQSAGKLARKLFSALSDVHPSRSHLVVGDFYPYFRSTADAEAAFAIFDKDGNGDISKREMREAVRRIYRERKALTASLKDVGSAVAKLDVVMLALALIVEIFICLLIFNSKNTIASLVPLATLILGFSFVFGHSAQTLFESLIFIFSTHVFDVGDLVMIDDQPLFVREFGLFSTTFRRVDGQEIIAPNALLASSKLVHNLRRSNSMWESTTLMISYDTPLEVIETLRSRLQAYVAQNSREWSNIGVNIDKMEFQNAIHLIIAMEHRPNWQDWGGRWARRTAFMRHLKTVLEELDVRYSMPVQPVIMPARPSPGLRVPASPSPSPSPSRGTPLLRPVPTMRKRNSPESLGNAGSFQGSESMAAAPSKSLRPGGDTF